MAHCVCLIYLENMLFIFVLFKCLQIIFILSTRCKTRIVSCGWSQDGTMIACGNSNNHLYIYHLDSGKTDTLMVNQSKGEETILWCVKFISSNQYHYNMDFIDRVVIGDSRGNLQIWNTQKRIMQDNHKAHEGDVLSLSVFTYYDYSASSTALYPTTLIVSGGVDGKVGLGRLVDV